MKKLFIYCLKISFLGNIDNVVHLGEMDGKKNINCASGDLDARQGERDGLQAHAPVTIGPYSVLIYSQDRQ